MRILIILISCLLPFSVADDLTQISHNEIPNEDIVSDDESKWRLEAIHKMWEERRKMGHTPLVKFSPPGFPNTDIFFKNETVSATRTLKHRFAWALLLWAIVEGKVTSKTSAVYDATSGNMGSAEAYMCTLVGIPYFAVVSEECEQEKIDNIEKFGGKVIKVPTALRTTKSNEFAIENNGFYINQQKNAALAEEFHESGDFINYESSNVFHEILVQLKDNEKQTSKVPDFFVHPAGTGGTVSSVGRYVVKYGLPTKVVLADSQFSVYYDYVIGNKFTNQTGEKVWRAPGIAGTGYGYDIVPIQYGETTSLTKNVINEAMKMPDIATVAAMRILNEMGYNAGASTSLNFLVCLYKAYQTKQKSSNNEYQLTIATLAGDPGDFYHSTYLDDGWVDTHLNYVGGVTAMECWKKLIQESIDTGSNFYLNGLTMCS